MSSSVYPWILRNHSPFVEARLLAEKSKGREMLLEIRVIQLEKRRKEKMVENARKKEKETRWNKTCFYVEPCYQLRGQRFASLWKRICARFFLVLLFSLIISLLFSYLSFFFIRTYTSDRKSRKSFKSICNSNLVPLRGKWLVAIS